MKDNSLDKRDNLKQYSVLPKLKYIQDQIDQLDSDLKALSSRVEKLDKRPFWQRWFS